MSARYYDPTFYLCSKEMPFTIRIQTTLRSPVQPAALTAALTRAMRRYRHFAMQVVEQGGEWLAAQNPRPPVVYPGPAVRPLGSDGVNGHLIAVSYDGREVNFYCSHVIADGAGLFPFIKSVLYFYLSDLYGVPADAEDLRTDDTPLFPDECTNPYPEERMAAAVPLALPPTGPFFRLTDGGFVNDRQNTVYRFSVSQAEVMRFNHDNDGSPCALVSSLMTRAIWALHPEVTADIVSAVSFNWRPALGCPHNHRMLCSAIPLRYPVRLRKAPIAHLCTCSRGMVTVQSQPENVLYHAQQRRIRMENLLALPGTAAKQAALAPAALSDAVNNTFSVSYVGRLGLGSMEPYIESMYNITDGSTYQTVFIEISSVNGRFDIAFLQGFSSDVYYRAFLEQLRLCGIGYTEDGVMPFGTPTIELP